MSKKEFKNFWVDEDNDKRSMDDLAEFASYTMRESRLNKERIEVFEKAYHLLEQRLLKLEKQIIEPIAQRIVDNVSQFSSCYKKMDFSEAVKVMRQGYNVSRYTAGKKCNRVFMKDNILRCHDIEKGETGNLVLRLEDIEAKDWIIL